MRFSIRKTIDSQNKQSKAFKIFKGSAFRAISFTINLLLLFFLMPYIVKTLGDRLYGLWALAASFTTYYYLFDPGITAAVNRFVANLIGKKREKENSVLITNSVFLFFFISAIGLVITAVLVYYLEFFVSHDILFTCRILVTVIGLDVVVTLPLRPYLGVLRAYLDFDVLSILETIKIILRTVMIVFFLSAGFGIISLVIINLIFNMLYSVSILITVKIKYPSIKYQREYVKIKEIKKLFDFSKYVFLTQIGDLLKLRLDGFLIAGFLGLPAVTAYMIASRIVEYFKQFMMQLTGVMDPVYSQYYGSGDLMSLREKFLMTFRISVLVSFFICGNIIIFGESFISNWMGGQYTSSYTLLVILIVPFAIGLSQGRSAGIFQSIDKHHIYAAINLSEGTANLVLSLILVQYYGLIGIALGTAIPMTVNKLFIQPVIVCRLIGIEIKLLLARIINIVLFLLLFFIAVYYLVHTILNPESISYYYMTVVILLEGLLIITIIYSLMLYPEEKNIFRSIMRKTIRTEQDG